MSLVGKSWRSREKASAWPPFSRCVAGREHRTGVLVVHRERDVDLHPAHPVDDPLEAGEVDRHDVGHGDAGEVAQRVRHPAWAALRVGPVDLAALPARVAWHVEHGRDVRRRVHTDEVEGIAAGAAHSGAEVASDQCDEEHVGRGAGRVGRRELLDLHVRRAGRDGARGRRRARPRSGRRARRRRRS